MGSDVGILSHPEGRAGIADLAFRRARKFLVLMLLQFRMAAIGILGRKVLKKRGLTGLCFDSLEYCGAEIREVWPSISSRLETRIGH